METIFDNWVWALLAVLVVYTIVKQFLPRFRGEHKYLTRLDQSYVKHYDLDRKANWNEGEDNHFTGLLNSEGYIAGTMINSFGQPSVLEGRVYRLLCFRLLIGRATNYPGFPNGAPYYKFSIITKHTSRGILLGQRGFVYIKLNRERIPV